MRQLTGRGGDAAAVGDRAGEGRKTAEAALQTVDAEPEAEGILAAEFAIIDAVLARSSAILQGVAVGRSTRPEIAPQRDPLIYDADWDEPARIEEWRVLVDRTGELPVVLAAAVLWDSWERVGPLQHQPWLGVLLLEAVLRQRRKTTAHLLALNTGLRIVARDRRRHRDRTTRLLAFLDAVAEAAALGLKEHDRLAMAREQMLRRLKGRRGNSKLPQLIDYVLARPLVSSAMIEKQLRVTTRGALNLVGELHLREITGRGRYRAWGV